MSIRSLRLVHIGTADNIGGAAHAAYALHLGLLKAGHQSRMLVNQQREQSPEISRIGFPFTLPGRIVNRLVLEVEMTTGLQYLVQPLRNRFLTHPFTRDSEIIHLHNLHGNFFSPFTLPRLSQIAPIVWTLHDTWALTGHCTYNYDCERWSTGCGECPNLKEHPRLRVDTTAFLWRIKDHVYKDSDIAVVAPSRWLARMARESPLLRRFPVHCIPYGIDTDKFRQMNRRLARHQLDIDPDVPLVMVVAIPEGERKGVDYFIEAMHKLRPGRRPAVLAVGGLDFRKRLPEECKVYAQGYVQSAEKMNLCYAAADLFVLPTLADNLPVSLLESFSVGTPAVGFDVGGVPDLIRHGSTGYLARHKDSEDLASGIRLLITDVSLRLNMGQRCRQMIRQEYADAICVHSYEQLYATLLESRRTLALPNKD